MHECLVLPMTSEFLLWGMQLASRLSIVFAGARDHTASGMRHQASAPVLSQHQHQASAKQITLQRSRLLGLALGRLPL